MLGFPRRHWICLFCCKLMLGSGSVQAFDGAECITAVWFEHEETAAQRNSKNTWNCWQQHVEQTLNGIKSGKTKKTWAQNSNTESANAGSDEAIIGETWSASSDKTVKHWCAATRENVCEIPAVCLCSSCVLLFQTGSAVLSVAFDLSFPPASCWGGKIDDDHYCVQALPPSSIFFWFIQSKRRMWVLSQFAHLASKVWFGGTWAKSRKLLNMAFFDLTKWIACHVLSGPIFGHGFVYDDESHTLEQVRCRVFVLRFWQASFFECQPLSSSIVQATLSQQWKLGTHYVSKTFSNTMGKYSQSVWRTLSTFCFTQFQGTEDTLD